jgi:mxaJ protein
MYSRFPSGRLLLIVPICTMVLAACSGSSPLSATEDTLAKVYIEPPKQIKIPASTTALRICADPNNLPFSNQKGEGFENKIASLIADDMHLPVEYTWWAQRRGFFRNTLKAGLCDVVIGVPNSFEMAATTQPYYRSTYVFVTRRDRNLDVKSFDDPELRNLTIGVQMIGDDGANAPPVHALNNRGIVSNLKGYTLYGDYRQDSPPARIVDAVAKKDVDIAVVWGPLAGYFAKKENVPLEIRPVSPEIDLPYLPFVYDISVGVRRGEDELKGKIDEILSRRHNDIRQILDAYGVPEVADGRMLAAKEEGK